MRVRPCVLGLFSSTIFSVNSCNNSGRSRNGFRRADSVSPFLFMFSVSVGSGNRCPRTVLLVLSLRVDSGRTIGITESCGNDAGDVRVVELEEPVDKPGTTIGTLFSVLHCIRLSS